MPRAVGDWFELVHGLGEVDPACGGTRDLQGPGGTKAGRKKDLESLFWRAGDVGRLGRTSANIVGQTGTLCFLESRLPGHREVRACLAIFSLGLTHPQQLTLGTDLGKVSLVREHPSASR